MGRHKGKLKKRPCLRCDKLFQGTVEMRICSDCKDAPAFRDAAAGFSFGVFSTQIKRPSAP